MARVLVAGGIVAAVALVAFLVGRRPPAAPIQGRWPVPVQLDRGDFGRPEAEWLVVVFSSSTCFSCAEVVAKASALASPAVAVEEVEVRARPELHRRYGVEAVPLVVVADAHGAVRASFVGPPSASDLWAAVAEAREPGSAPEPGLGPPGAASL